MKITFVGDVHGKVHGLPVELPNPVVQVGDLGVGFVASRLQRALATRHNFYFIRGNHDNPRECKAMQSYLGDYGEAVLGGAVRFFFVAGAYSIDKHLRVEGRDWWADEEMSMRQLHDAIDLFSATKPRVMVTHDAPTDIAQKVIESHDKVGDWGPLVPSRTNQALQAMWELHKPELWIFGHHHVSRDMTVDGTRFVCLAELEQMTLDV